MIARGWVVAALLGALAASAPAFGERMQRLGGYEAHYSLVPTTVLNADIVGRYGITRGRDRALLNVSILEDGQRPVRAEVSGTVTDLLGQVRDLGLEEVVEGEAVYYLAEVRHDDREVLRFEVALKTPDGADHTLKFQQKMYWEGR